MSHPRGPKLARCSRAMVLTKFCEKSSTHTQASGDILREENSSLPSLAPLTTAEEYCAVAALESNMKKKEDARLAVLREYDRWAKDHPKDATKMGGYVFFGYLEKERPDLLDFRPVGSKWQTVHGWLRHGGRLKD